MLLSQMRNVILWFSALALLSSMANAQEQQQAEQAVKSVDVKNIRFNSVRGPSGDNWYQMEVELEAVANPTGEAAPNSRYVDDIEVVVTLGFAIASHGSEYTFYRASARLVSLQVRSRASVYFYLPWEVAERDRLQSRDPQFYAVQISAGGVPVPGESSHFSNSIRDAAALQNFLNAAEQGISRTEGILLPTYLTPFAGSEARRNPPSYIRIETE